MKYLIQTAVFLLVSSSICAQDSQTYLFGSGASEKNTTLVSVPVRYKSSTGYGFDFENIDQVKIVGSEKNGPGYCTFEAPFYFSIRVPEGSYDVSVLLRNPECESETTIKAEARRLMLFNYPLKKGGSELIHFIVNVRNPVIEGTDSIRLNSREYNYMNWDDRLTLEFSGTNQSVHQINVQPAKKITTLYLAGNSTVTDQYHEPWASWGR